MYVRLMRVVGDVVGCDAAATLGFVVAQRRVEDEAAVEQLRGVCHYADLHRTGEVGAVDPEVAGQLAGGDLRLLDDHLGLEGELRLAGEGAFMVAEFAVAELAAALGMSETAGRAMVGQSLELRDRLPLLWRRVLALEMPVWKARQVARLTIPLNAAAAAAVDREVAPAAHRLGLTRLLRVVDAAVLRHDPDLAAARAAAAGERRGVWVEDHLAGVSEIHAVADTPDAAAFDAALDTVATTLGVLGDADPHHVRRAKALGVLADPQYTLDLHTTASGGTGTGGPRGAGLPVRERATVQVHLHLEAITGRLAAGEGPVARVDGYGPRTLAAVQRWLTGLTPGTRITLTPVVDLTEQIAVDAYEIPARLRRQVEHRELTCAFPWCGRAGWYDLDHVQPYQPMVGGGPPGQTSSGNLSRLCRFHHRVKTHPGTHGRWHSTREPDDSLTWISPLGLRYRVDHTGTTQLRK